MILVKKSLDAKFKLNKCQLNETDLTMTTPRGDICHFLVLYRSPTPNAKVYGKLGYDMNDDPHKRHLNWLNRRITQYLLKPEPVLVVGDLNVHLDRETPTQADRFAIENWRCVLDQYQDLFDGFHTYESKDGVKSHIDYALTNIKYKIQMKVLDHVRTSSWSDHKVFEWKWPVLIPDPKTRRKSLVKMKLKPSEHIRNEETMRQIEENIFARLPMVNNNQELVTMMEEETFKLLPVEEKFIPTEEEKAKDDPYVQSLYEERQELVRSLNLNGIGKIYHSMNHQLKQSSYKITKAKKMAKMNIIRARARSRGAKADQWTHFREHKSKSKPLPNFITPNSMGKFFNKLSHTYKDKGKTILPITEAVDKFEFTLLERINQDLGLLKNLKKMLFDGRGSKHAYAKDGLTFMSVKQYSDNMLNLLKEVVNDVFETGRYPKTFREATLNVVPKKPEIEVFKDCRPVTVSRQHAMITEKVATKQLTFAAETRNWLKPAQFGFRPNRSIGQLLNRLRKSIAKLKLTEEGKYHCILLTDLSNAFGSSDIEIILNELRNDLNPKAMQVIKAFLSQCTSQVKIGSEFSKPFHMAPRGFSQGACLSPLLFCLIMRYMHERVDFEGYSFADDATFLIYGPTEEIMIERIYKCLGQFYDFCDSLNIKLNIGKTLYIYPKELNLIFKGEEIKREENSRVLGVRIDHKVGNKAQIDYLLNHLNLTHVMIRGYGSFCDKRMVLCLVNAHGHGKINHTSAYFDLSPSGEYTKLQNKVNKMIKVKAIRNLLTEFYLDQGLIDETMDTNLIFEARGKRLIHLDIQDLLEYREHLIGNPIHDIEIYNVNRRLRNLERQFQNAETRRLTQIEKKVILDAIKSRDRLRQTYPHYDHLSLPQWIKMKTMKVTSVQNNIRKNQMNRLGSTILRARPIFEFDEVLEFATDHFIREDGRVTTDYPHFHATLARDRSANQSILRRCTPQMWFNEFKKLPRSVKIGLKERNFISRVKKHFQSRCQHEEEGTTRCENCNRPQNCYTLSHSQEIAQNFQRIERETETVYDIADQTLSESEVLEVSTDTDGHLIYNITTEAFSVLQRRLNELLTAEN